MSSDSDYSLIERAVGTAVASVVYKEFKGDFREAEMRVHIRRHVRRAEAVKEELEVIQNGK